MQEEINEKVIAPYIKGGKITTKLLQKAMKIFLPEIKKQAAERMRKSGALLRNRHLKYLAEPYYLRAFQLLTVFDTYILEIKV